MKRQVFKEPKGSSPSEVYFDNDKSSYMRDSSPSRLDFITLLLTDGTNLLMNLNVPNSSLYFHLIELIHFAL